MFQQRETGDGTWVVLKFWPNFRLSVLIKVVIIKKSVRKPCNPCDPTKFSINGSDGSMCDIYCVNAGKTTCTWHTQVCNLPLNCMWKKCELCTFLYWIHLCKCVKYRLANMLLFIVHGSVREWWKRKQKSKQLEFLPFWCPEKSAKMS